MQTILKKGMCGEAQCLVFAFSLHFVLSNSFQDFDQIDGPNDYLRYKIGHISDERNVKNQTFC